MAGCLIYFYDPVSKDDTALNNYAIAELKRLRNGILRGSAITPVLGDAYPEQQVQVTTPSANYSNTFLRATTIIHRFSPQGMLTEFQLSDDFIHACLDSAVGLLDYHMQECVGPLRFSSRCARSGHYHSGCHIHRCLPNRSRRN